MLASLKIHPDDDVYVLEDLESVFEVEITNDEAQSVVTVGELFDVIKSKLINFKNRKCDTSMVFYKIKNALKAQIITNDFSPETALSETIIGSPKTFFKDLSVETGLNFDLLTYTKYGKSGFAICLIAFLLLILFIFLEVKYLLYLIPSALFIFGTIIISSDKMQVSNNLKTVRDLCEKIAMQNFGQLVNQGARATPQKIWDAYIEVLSNNADVSNSKLISRDTKLL